MALAARRRPTDAAHSILPKALGDRLEWNPKLQRYRDALSKRIISAVDVRAEIDREIDASERRLARHGRRWFNGLTDINDFRALAADEIKLNFLANYAAAKGGFAQMTPEDYKAVEGMVKRQFTYLERFMRQLDANPEALSQDALLNRLGMYAQAGREAYEQSRRISHKNAGFLYERNLTHALESCHSRKGKRGCSELSNAGWQLIGTLPNVGRRACYARCKCTLEYSKELPAGYVIRVLPSLKNDGPKTLRTKTPGNIGGDDQDAKKKAQADQRAAEQAEARRLADIAKKDQEAARLADEARKREEDRKRKAAPNARKALEVIEARQAADLAANRAEIQRLTSEYAQTEDDRIAAIVSGQGDDVKRAIYDRQDTINRQRVQAQRRELEIRDAAALEARESLYVPATERAQISVNVQKRLKASGPTSKNIDEGVEAFQKMVGIPIPDATIINFEYEPKGRSAYRDATQTVLAKAFIPPRVVVHELGHWLEYRAPGVQKKAFDFYARRTAGEPLQRLRDVTGIKGYKTTEVTRVDKWKNSYTGKWYTDYSGKQRATEIVSMGMEDMYADPVQFAKDDPEYFDFMYNLLRGYD